MVTQNLQSPGTDHRVAGESSASRPFGLLAVNKFISEYDNRNAELYFSEKTGIPIT